MAIMFSVLGFSFFIYAFLKFNNNPLVVNTSRRELTRCICKDSTRIVESFLLQDKYPVMFSYTVVCADTYASLLDAP